MLKAANELDGPIITTGNVYKLAPALRDYSKSSGLNGNVCCVLRRIADALEKDEDDTDGEVATGMAKTTAPPASSVVGSSSSTGYMGAMFQKSSKHSRDPMDLEEPPTKKQSPSVWLWRTGSSILAHQSVCFSERVKA